MENPAVLAGLAVDMHPSASGFAEFYGLAGRNDEEFVGSGRRNWTVH